MVRTWSAAGSRKVGASQSSYARQCATGTSGNMVPRALPREGSSTTRVISMSPSAMVSMSPACAPDGGRARAAETSPATMRSGWQYSSVNTRVHRTVVQSSKL